MCACFVVVRVSLTTCIKLSILAGNLGAKLLLRENTLYAMTFVRALTKNEVRAKCECPFGPLGQIQKDTRNATDLLHL